MTGTVDKLLGELKCGAQLLYGSRLRRLYLYGSYARGEQESDSDLDVLFVLDQIDSYGAEIDRTSELISSLALQHGIGVSRVFVTEERWRNAQSAFFTVVREEAVAA